MNGWNKNTEGGADTNTKLSREDRKILDAIARF